MRASIPTASNGVASNNHARLRVAFLLLESLVSPATMSFVFAPATFTSTLELLFDPIPNTLGKNHAAAIILGPFAATLVLLELELLFEF